MGCRENRFRACHGIIVQSLRWSLVATHETNKRNSRPIAGFLDQLAEGITDIGSGADDRRLAHVAALIEGVGIAGISKRIAGRVVDREC